MSRRTHTEPPLPAAWRTLALAAGVTCLQAHGLPPELAARITARWPWTFAVLVEQLRLDRRLSVIPPLLWCNRREWRALHQALRGAGGTDEPAQ